MDFYTFKYIKYHFQLVNAGFLNHQQYVSSLEGNKNYRECHPAPKFFRDEIFQRKTGLFMSFGESQRLHNRLVTPEKQASGFRIREYPTPSKKMTLVMQGLVKELQPVSYPFFANHGLGESFACILLHLNLSH